MESIKRIARELGMTSIQKRLERAEAIPDRKHINIAVMGASNAGKTTLINGILDQEIMEPSLLPYEGKPLRVSFERIPEDECCKCIFVISDAWGNNDVLLYELSSDTVIGDQQDLENCHWIDELDYVFYLMPATHFMTAEDRSALRELCNLPVQVIVTKFDEVGALQRDEILAYVDALCVDAALSRPLMADQQNWPKLLKEMRGALPITNDLDALRKKHAGCIAEECRMQLQTVIRRSIQEEAEKAKMADQRRAEQIDALHLRRSLLEKKLAETKLACVRACNEALDNIRVIAAQLDRYADHQCRLGTKSGFDKGTLRSFEAEAIAMGNDQIGQIGNRVVNDVNSILGDARKEQFLSEGVADELREQARRIATIDVQKRNMYVNAPSVVDAHFFPTALAVGAASAVALIVPVSPLVTGGIIAAALGTGGIVCFQHYQSEKRKRNVTDVKSWSREFASKLQETLRHAVQEEYDAVLRALVLPTLWEPVQESTATQEDRIRILEEMEKELCH